MLQEIMPEYLENHYDGGKKAEEDDFIMIYREHQMLVRISEDGILSLPKKSEIFSVSEQIPEGALYYLFSVKDQKEKGDGGREERFFLDRSGVSIEKLLHSGYSFFSVKKIGSLVPEPKKYVYAIYTAMHLAEWYDTKKFCGICGQKLCHDETERAMTCKACGKKYYPRINPAVIVGVKNGNRLLLTRYREGYRHNALVAGFCEIGETMEETVMREVFEETGLHVKNIRYYKSQPWGNVQDILMGFYCELDGDSTIRMDRNELKEAVWVKREDIQGQFDDWSLTHHMMMAFKEGREPK